jgi:hypothetical protein
MVPAQSICDCQNWHNIFLQTASAAQLRLRSLSSNTFREGADAADLNEGIRLRGRLCDGNLLCFSTSNVHRHLRNPTTHHHPTLTMSDLERGIVKDDPDAEKADIHEHGTLRMLTLSDRERDILSANENPTDHAGLSYEEVSEALYKLHVYHDIGRSGTGGNVTINHMHVNNIAYLRSKVMKHALIFNAARAETGEDLFRQCE